MCTCKQYTPINLELYRFKEHKLNDIKYAVAFRRHRSGFGSKRIGFRYKTSNKHSFVHAIVDESFTYDILTSPANDFVNEFNQYLNNNEKIFNKVHIPSLFISSLFTIFIIFMLLIFKNRDM